MDFVAKPRNPHTGFESLFEDALCNFPEDSVQGLWDLESQNPQSFLE